MSFQQNYSAENFTSDPISATFCPVVAKSTAEPENSFIFRLANSTPLACFFIRSIHTPKERLKEACSAMVVCNGKGSPFVVFQSRRFLSPLRTTAQTLRSLAVVFIHHRLEQIAMIYQFIGISRQHYDQTQPEQIRILAENETQARALKAREYVLVLVGKLPDTAFNANTFNAMGLVLPQSHAKKRQNPTACDFTTAQNADNIAGTTTKNGHRTRQICGFFAPQIPQRGLLTHVQAEFVARSIRRNKPSNRTNNASRFFAVVEALPRLTMAGKSYLLNKEKSKMKTPTPQANTAQHLPITLSSRFEGVMYV